MRAKHLTEIPYKTICCLNEVDLGDGVSSNCLPFLVTFLGAKNDNKYWKKTNKEDKNNLRDDKNITKVAKTVSKITKTVQEIIKTTRKIIKTT